MSEPRSHNFIEVLDLLRQLNVGQIKIPSGFSEQVKLVNKLLNNDKTGLVTPILDFMSHSATVPMKIETQNETLDKAMQVWQENILNRDVNIDIPGGLRQLSVQYYKERWKSSLIGLKVLWGEQDIGRDSKLIVPKKMWVLNGGAISSEQNTSINNTKYFLKTTSGKKQLTNSLTESIFIRKPYTSWYEKNAVPYLVRRGALFNALLKNVIVQKQSDVIETIMPYLLQIKAGSDTLANTGLMPTEEELRDLKQQIVDGNHGFEHSKNFKDLIASLRYDVNLEHLIPDLRKLFDDAIVKPIDRNLLSSLGLIELQGFSSTRQEAILNPKVLIEEVTDAVLDWSDLLQDVIVEMMNRNMTSFPNLANNKVNIIPGTIKAFITDDMRSMFRSLYDRGLLSKQNAVEDISNLNFEVQVDRRNKETQRNLDDTLKPPIIQNLEQFEEPDLENQDKKPGTPESDNFNQSILENYRKSRVHRKKDRKKKKKSIFDTNEELPENVKVLPQEGQTIWRKSFNSALEQGNSETTAIKIAWSAVKKVFKKNDDGEWVKKKNSKIETIDDLPEDIKSNMTLAQQIKFVKSL